MAGISVSETQLISSRNRMPSSCPPSSMSSMTPADDLAHGIFRDGAGFALKRFFLQQGKADSALPGMVRHGIGKEADAAFRGGLFHDGGLSDAGSPDEQDGPLFF